MRTLSLRVQVRKVLLAEFSAHWITSYTSTILGVSIFSGIGFFRSKTSRLRLAGTLPMLSRISPWSSCNKTKVIPIRDTLRARERPRRVSNSVWRQPVEALVVFGPRGVWTAAFRLAERCRRRTWGLCRADGIASPGPGRWTDTSTCRERSHVHGLTLVWWSLASVHLDSKPPTHPTADLPVCMEVHVGIHLGAGLRLHPGGTVTRNCCTSRHTFLSPPRCWTRHTRLLVWCVSPWGPKRGRWEWCEEQESHAALCAQNSVRTSRRGV